MKPPRTRLEPPRPLGHHGRELWDTIQSEFFLEDAAGIEILAQACAALDLAEALAAQIARDGTLRSLGIADEPIRSVGPGPRRKGARQDEDD